jgi:hypothetical protein
VALPGCAGTSVAPGIVNRSLWKEIRSGPSEEKEKELITGQEADAQTSGEETGHSTEVVSACQVLFVSIMPTTYFTPGWGDTDAIQMCSLCEYQPGCHLVLSQREMMTDWGLGL